jgi:hypothetical protein
MADEKQTARPTQQELDAAIASLPETGSRIKTMAAGHRHSVGLVRGCSVGPREDEGLG